MTGRSKRSVRAVLGMLGGSIAYPGSDACAARRLSTAIRFT